jgi:hypothetical protein
MTASYELLVKDRRCRELLPANVNQLSNTVQCIGLLALANMSVCRKVGCLETLSVARTA